MDLKALAWKFLKWTLILVFAVPLGLLLLLSVLFPKEMNAVFTFQSAQLVRESGTAIATRIGAPALAGPLGWALIVCCIVSLFLKGEHLNGVERFLEGYARDGSVRTLFLLWHAVFFPVNVVLSLAGDLLTMNILHMPLGVIECYRASFEAIRELLTFGKQRSGYL